MALITDLPNNAEPALSAEIARRGDTCDATSVEIAKQRLSDIGWGRPTPTEDDLQHEARAARIRAAGRAYLELQDQQRQRVVQPARPVTTTCKDTYAGVRCTSF
jgi:hypothetical protein